MRALFFFPLHGSHRSKEVKGLIFTIRWLYIHGDLHSEATAKEESEVEHHLPAGLVFEEDTPRLLTKGCWVVSYEQQGERQHSQSPDLHGCLVEGSSSITCL